MLNTRLRLLIDPAILWLARLFHRYGISANRMTAIGVLVSFLAILALSSGFFFLAFLLIIANRALAIAGKMRMHLSQPDVIDNSGQPEENDFSKFFRLLADSIFYAGIPMGFALYHPGANGAGAAFLLFALLVLGLSRQIFAVILTQRGQGAFAAIAPGKLMESGAPFGIFVLMCLFPMFFDTLAVLLGVLCAGGAVMQIMAARLLLR